MYCYDLNGLALMILTHDHAQALIDIGDKHHQDKTNDVVDVYHKFSCSESITNSMILLVVYHNLAVSDVVHCLKKE